MNSYKGLVSHGIDPTGMARDMSWAPVVVAYGDNNRSLMIRLPLGRDCVENRAADMTMNVYWAAAISLAAGLEGIREGLDPGAPFGGNVYEASASELAASAVRFLPRTLTEALEAFARDPIAEDAFGPGPKQAFLGLKREEWHTFHQHISDWERERYLHFY